MWQYVANKNSNKDYNINQIRYSYAGGNIFASVVMEEIYDYIMGDYYVL